ncbi:hypothetical protein V1512DRAFT_66343 [Lipomyces arxii]|uniref:uncharacterized protein n=1 Tax=Lipomyces arxii TaxID=56418 RepID=UPI0034CF7934
MIWKSCLLVVSQAILALCLSQTQSITFRPSKDTLSLVHKNQAVPLLVDSNDWSGVIRAASDLAEDFRRVSQIPLRLLNVSGIDDTCARHRWKGAVIVGTLGKSPLIDSIAGSGKINVTEIEGKWESYTSAVVSSPLPCISSALVIAGSDKRGSIFGIYDISEQIGVSPWYYFADVAPKQHKSIYALPIVHVQGEPSVKYRGIFINDEAPALTNYVNQFYETGPYGSAFTHQFYLRVFELLLRLKANLLWPTMWASMFAVDDTLNAVMADMYGIVMSTSHTEPLMRATNEWTTFGKGDWLYATNKKNITDFWKDGVIRNAPFENVWTMGMRGLGDNALEGGVQIELLEDVIHTQRELLKNYQNITKISETPQVWCLYKEVQSYYEEGMSVPEDIILLWSDDNWGNARRLPLNNETSRPGGSGIYYHFDYVGDPRDYKWINTVQLSKTWEQLHLTYQRQARDMWIVNVGDLKPLEIPIDYFLSLAYDFDIWGGLNKVHDWEIAWATREFGSRYASQIADIIDDYGRYAARRKYELLDPSTYSLVNYLEAETVLTEWRDLSARANRIYDQLSSADKPAFFELVLHPAAAGEIVNDVLISSAQNNLYASQRRSSANAMATHVLNRFRDDYNLKTRYHTQLNGKWNHIMDQTHLGYYYWQQPMRDVTPPLSFSQLSENSLAGSLGVGAESSYGSIPGDDLYNAAPYNNFSILLPTLDPYSSRQYRYFDVFNKGNENFEFSINASAEWVVISQSVGAIASDGTDNDVRVHVSVDWDAAPLGYDVAEIDIYSSVSYGSVTHPIIYLPINKTIVPKSFSNGFVESNQYVSIEAEHFSRNTSSKDAEYVVIEKYGRTLSGVTLFPVTADTQVAPRSPRLDYDMYLFTVPEYGANVTLYISPSLNTNPHRPIMYGISFDDEEIQNVQVSYDAPSAANMPDRWEDAVSDNVWIRNTTHAIIEPGKHVLKIWALEPGLVFQKLVVDLGGVEQSYLGPPESMRL